MTTYKIKRFGITITPGAKEVNAVPEIIKPTPAPNLPAVSSQALTGTVSMPGAGTKPGMFQNLANSWKNLPTAGKVGLGAAAVVGTGLAVHGLMKKKKKNNDQ